MNRRERCDGAGRRGFVEGDEPIFRPGRRRHVADGVFAQFLIALLRPQEINRAPACRLKEPGAKRAWIVKRAQRPVDRQPDFLLHVVAVVTNQPPQMRERARVEPFEEPAERGSSPAWHRSTQKRSRVSSSLGVDGTDMGPRARLISLARPGIRISV